MLYQRANSFKLVKKGDQSTCKKERLKKKKPKSGNKTNECIEVDCEEEGKQEKLRREHRF